METKEKVLLTDMTELKGRERYNERGTANMGRSEWSARGQEENCFRDVVTNALKAQRKRPKQQKDEWFATTEDCSFKDE